MASPRSSAPLISGTYAQWGERGYETHTLAGARIGAIAEMAFHRALQAAEQGLGMTEHDLSEWILAEIASAGLAEGGTIVGTGANSASPHYEPVAGESAVPTPNLARIAEEGIIFDNCYTPCPVCTPARASLISGLYPHNHNI